MIEVGAKVRLNGHNFVCEVVKVLPKSDYRPSDCAVIVAGRKQTVARFADLELV